MWDTFKEYLKSFFSSRLMPITLVFVLLFAVLVNRLFQLQIIEGDMYASEAIGEPMCLFRNMECIFGFMQTATAGFISSRILISRVLHQEIRKESQQRCDL